MNRTANLDEFRISHTFGIPCLNRYQTFPSPKNVTANFSTLILRLMSLAHHVSFRPRNPSFDSLSLFTKPPPQHSLLSHTHTHIYIFIYVIQAHKFFILNLHVDRTKTHLLPSLGILRLVEAGHVNPFPQIFFLVSKVPKY